MSEETALPKPANPVPSKDGEGLAETPCSAPEAHKLINDRLEVRPFNEAGEKDANWHYVHRCNAHQAAQIATREGVVLLAAWLVDNAEGETITEELLLQWGSQCIQENDPDARLLKQNK